MSDETDRTNALRNLMYWRDRAFTGRDVETYVHAAAEISRLNQEVRFLLGCVYTLAEGTGLVDKDALRVDDIWKRYSDE